jgi:gliding motility associated protien GldN
MKMNKRIIKICLFSLLIGSISSTVGAQRTSRRNQQASAQNATTNPPANAKTPITGFDNSIPMRYDTASTSDSISTSSLRDDNVFGKGSDNDRIPLPYEHLRWDDALYSEKVWREIDFREKMNQTFRYQSDDNNGNQMFINILLKAVSSGQVMAFNAIDDRFTTPMTPAEVTQLTRGALDTDEVRDVIDPTIIREYLVTRKAFDPKTVTRIRIKEEWVFDREASRMFCRIIGVAPLKTQYNANGTERGSTVMFWVNYPDLRPILANYEVYNPKNMGYGHMTWEELFEARMFSSTIVKSSLDNPGNKMLRQMTKDPILALLEGDNTRQRIFNYEQDLWSY